MKHVKITPTQKFSRLQYTKTVYFRPDVVCKPPPKTFADPYNVRDAIDILQYAEKPLVIVGKG